MNNIIEAALKGWVTSIFGLVCMVYALIDWRADQLNDWQAGGLAIAGLSLIFVKDKISEWIGKFFAAIIEKFTGKK